MEQRRRPVQIPQRARRSSVSVGFTGLEPWGRIVVRLPARLDGCFVGVGGGGGKRDQPYKGPLMGGGSRRSSLGDGLEGDVAGARGRIASMTEHKHTLLHNKHHPSSGDDSGTLTRRELPSAGSSLNRERHCSAFSIFEYVFVTQ